MTISFQTVYAVSQVAWAIMEASNLIAFIISFIVILIYILENHRSDYTQRTVQHVNQKLSDYQISDRTKLWFMNYKNHKKLIKKIGGNNGKSRYF